MMKRESKGLGSCIYSEWIIVIVDYYRVLRKSEVIYETVVPVIGAILCSIIYYNIGKVYIALKGLSNILPTAISVLIGFTAMLITLLLTSNSDSVNKLKSITLEKRIHNQEVSLYHGLLIQFSHILVSEIVLLISVFFYLFCAGVGIGLVVAVLLLAVEIYLILNILLSVLRGITNIYFSFYRIK